MLGYLLVWYNILYTYHLRVCMTQFYGIINSCIKDLFLIPLHRCIRMVKTTKTGFEWKSKFINKFCENIQIYH